jgi:hypothetical protein
MDEERYNDIMIVVRYREPNDYYRFDEFLDDINIEEHDEYLSQLDVVSLFQAWLEYKDEPDFKLKPLKYIRKLD